LDLESHPRHRDDGRRAGVAADGSGAAPVVGSSCSALRRVGSSCSALRRPALAVTRPRLTSAHPSPRLATLLASSADGQTSRGKARDFHPTNPPHIRPTGPGGFGLRIFWPPYPPSGRLSCGSCTSGRGFAYSFLPTSPRDDAVAVRLGIPATRAPRGLSPPSHFPARFPLPVEGAPGTPRAMPGAEKKAPLIPRGAFSNGRNPGAGCSTQSALVADERPAAGSCVFRPILNADSGAT
jgi:hypothetical protein